MSGEKKPESPLRSPVEWVFRSSLMLFGAVIALNLAVSSLKPILPWLISGIGLVACTWLMVTVVRWKRSRW